MEEPEIMAFMVLDKYSSASGARRSVLGKGACKV